jgi:hypothetical protein
MYGGNRNEFTCNINIFRPSMPSKGISFYITDRSSINCNLEGLILLYVIAEDVRGGRNLGERLNNNVFVIHDCVLCWPYYLKKVMQTTKVNYKIRRPRGGEEV